ncbi:MAG: FAD-dependent oxidoreductase [Gemmatimonadota bacterium]|nr:FAD-dependent oxidoreductase [Gemmatimonadota bacterium]
MTRPAFVVVGAGLTGATIARSLADRGHSVRVVERRPHLGGNVFDTVHHSGIRVHAHGPHYFRTSSDRLWAFVRRFSAFYPYEAKILSRIDGGYEPWPLSRALIARRFGDVSHAPVLAAPENFEAAMLAKMPRPIYDVFVREYTEKQWGVAPCTLDRRLAARVHVREHEDPRLTPKARHQGLPTDGYAAMVAGMLEGIPLTLDVDYLRERERWPASRLTIFTGPIDEYFGYCLGRLQYRAQQRETTYLPNVGWHQPVGQVNEPQHAAGALIRTIEWKHLLPPALAQQATGTVITTETPFTPVSPDDYEYPFPDAANHALYQRYRARAKAHPNVLICGRLGEYRYYDMDQAIGRARMLSARIA